MVTDDLDNSSFFGLGQVKTSLEIVCDRKAGNWRKGTIMPPGRECCEERNKRGRGTA